MASKEIALSAGDSIDGWTVVEIATDYWRRGETCVFLVPEDEEPKTGRTWTPTDQQPVVVPKRFCPECYQPSEHGYTLEELEG
jgi:hypothetical protein